MANDLIIKRKVCAKHKLSIQEYLVLAGLSVMNKDMVNTLVKLKYVTDNGELFIKSPFDRFTVTDKGTEHLNTIVMDSNIDKETATRISVLTEKLREIYPKGKMGDTTYYYRGNKIDIENRLRIFILKYGDYTDEQIIEATQRYISSFNGNYTYLKLLKYFIMKQIYEDGKVSTVSLLAEYIENPDFVRPVTDGWTIELR